MAEYNDLERKIEAAFAVVILAAGAAPAAKIFLAHDADSPTDDSCVIHARQGNEVAQGCGVYNVETEILTRSAGDAESEGADPVPAHDLLTAKVRDAVLQDGIVAELNAAGIEELTVVDVLNPRPSSGVEEGSRRFVNSLLLQVIAANASI